MDAMDVSQWRVAIAVVCLCAPGRDARCPRACLAWGLGRQRPAGPTAGRTHRTAAHAFKGAWAAWMYRGRSSSPPSRRANSLPTLRRERAAAGPPTQHSVPAARARRLPAGDLNERGRPRAPSTRVDPWVLGLIPRFGPNRSIPWAACVARSRCVVVSDPPRGKARRRHSLICVFPRWLRGTCGLARANSQERDSDSDGGGPGRCARAHSRRGSRPRRTGSIHSRDACGSTRQPDQPGTWCFVSVRC